MYISKWKKYQVNVQKKRFLAFMYMKSNFLWVPFALKEQYVVSFLIV